MIKIKYTYLEYYSPDNYSVILTTRPNLEYYSTTTFIS